MVAMAYQFPVVGAFWPLVCGLYWKKATRQGCYFSILAGSAVWVFLTWTAAGEVFPNVLGGFIAAGLGMAIGSLLPSADNRRFREGRDRDLEGPEGTSASSVILPATGTAAV